MAIRNVGLLGLFLGQSVSASVGAIHLLQFLRLNCSCFHLGDY
jgi:hypothetical protein